jgi:hypothetical protein
VALPQPGLDRSRTFRSCMSERVTTAQNDRIGDAARPSAGHVRPHLTLNTRVIFVAYRRCRSVAGSLSR